MHGLMIKMNKTIRIYQIYIVCWLCLLCVLILFANEINRSLKVRACEAHPDMRGSSGHEFLTTSC